MHDNTELPPELRAELRENRSLDLEANLAKLFDDGKQRTINDALVDYWHAYKIVIKRGTMIQTLAAMAKGGRAVRRAGKGVYVCIAPKPAQAPPQPYWPEDLNKIPAPCGGETGAGWAENAARKARGE